ncbi:poly-gamma-glutamate biosynthesis protein PgsC/CapC [Halomarina litorea]|uniref:poly-gamma-glutamate biosynthesis protein PgsC/CapC n=1 Tax=Halomarina litorea TaxID=2961595 RepID=UPI0020C43E6D|nr:poly-gamma-glutamate biosynthesis protein PgsC/CapC [Halomarina sp. BCD28]
MLVASLVLAVGLFAVAAVTQLRGLRLGGTIVAGVLAMYSLKNFVMLPLFVGSATLAAGVLWFVREHTLLYGRDEFVVTLLAGSGIPMLLLAVEFALPGPLSRALVRASFIGSVLPGLAAYNFMQVKPEHRREDLLASVGLLSVLLVVGGLLVGPETRFLADYAPLVLFAETSDIALLRGAVVDGPADPVIVAREVVVAAFGVGLVLSELARRTVGLRVGIVSLAILAVYTLSSVRLVGLFLVELVVLVAFVEAVNRTTLLYGRVLIGLATGTGVVLGVALTPLLGVELGLSALVVGLLAGIDAYNVHVTPPAERVQWLAVVLAMYAALLLVLRLVVQPLPDGAPQSLGLPTVVGGVLLVVGCLALALALGARKPDDRSVLSASVLSGGDG